MRIRVRRCLFLFASLIAVPFAVACGEEVTIPDPEPGLPDGSEGMDASGGLDAAAPDGLAPVDGGVDAADVVCPLVAPDSASGVFVSEAGTLGAACGTAAMPCRTIALGITRAAQLAVPKVYVARGSYVGAITLVAGIEIVGGWEPTGTTWRRACVSPEDAVVIRAGAAKNVTVEARDLGGEAALTLLRIESKTPAQVTAGESLYGVVAAGATTTLVMNDVRVVAGNAGDGANGPKGDAGAAGAPSCPPGGAALGTPGAQGPGATPNGAFDPLGYAPQPGLSGAAGGPGGSGAPGGAGTCVTCGTCGAYPLCDFVPDPGPQACGKNGTSGCGGGAGEPGAPANGGGSSIGVFVWDATVTINGGRVKSGDAGNGGVGGAGGAGGAATNGVAGASTDLCTVGCVPNAALLACVPTTARGVGGAAGGNGAIGGVGGAGGGGGGGSSFAIYQGGAGVVTTTPSTTLAFGKAGNGGGPNGGLGAGGAAAARVP